MQTVVEHVTQAETIILIIISSLQIPVSGKDQDLLSSPEAMIPSQSSFQFLLFSWGVSKRCLCLKHCRQDKRIPVVVFLEEDLQL